MHRQSPLLEDEQKEAGLPLQSKQINQDTRIKYYHFTQKDLEINGTCYCGKKDTFTKPTTEHPQELHYPDEYLIATILKKYILTLPSEHLSNRKIIILTQPWKNKSGTIIRNGKSNDSTSFNALIIKTVEENPDALILVPFLYGRHHPGIAIANKKVIYVEPLGGEGHRYNKYVKSLTKTLMGKGFEYKAVQEAQQTHELDKSSCGPILTASFIKFIDEYIKTGKISIKGFNAPRKQLATERMLQIRINNGSTLKDEFEVNEIMLADITLWEAFLKEQKIKEDIKQETIRIICMYKCFIQCLDNDWNKNEDCIRQVRDIIDFQSQMIHQVSTQNDAAIRELLNSTVSTPGYKFLSTKALAIEIIDNYLTSLSCCNFYGKKRALELKEMIKSCKELETLRHILFNFMKTGKTYSDNQWYNFFKSPTRSSGIGHNSLRGMMIDRLSIDLKSKPDWIRTIMIKEHFSDKPVMHDNKEADKPVARSAFVNSLLSWN